MNRYLTGVIVISLFVFTFSLNAFPNGNFYPDQEYNQGKEATSDTGQGAGMEKEKVSPNPQRIYCMKYWNKYYSERGIDIDVSTRGQYDETVVFSCPQCSLEEHFVEPFLQAETDGLTGRERIKACGYTKAIFIGSKGIREIEKDI